MTGFTRKAAWLLGILLAANAWQLLAQNQSDNANTTIDSEASFIASYLPTLYRHAQQADIIAALQQAGKLPFSLQRTLQKDKNWHKDTALQRRIAENALSHQFKKIVNDTNNTTSEILLIDRYGRLVAAYPTPSDYYQGDEAKFIRPASDKNYFVDRADWDESSGSVAIQIAMPVFDQQQFIGVLVKGVEVDLRILTRIKID